METENGGPFAVDLNENEEAIIRGGEGRENAGCKSHKAGVCGGQVAGKGQLCVTGNGTDVNTAPSMLYSGSRWEERNDVMLDLEKCLPGHLMDSCVISRICGDHIGFNGFTELPGQEEEEGGVGRGEGGFGFVGSTAASCPTETLNAKVAVGEDAARICDPHDELAYLAKCPLIPNGNVGSLGSTFGNCKQLGVDRSSCDEVKVANAKERESERVKDPLTP